ncbi:MAG: hypothetical protein CMF59_10550 [Leptospiraceae bacterium]|nr:hypothetical protein [Leptospiraceae bacterium]
MCQARDPSADTIQIIAIEHPANRLKCDSKGRPMKARLSGHKRCATVPSPPDGWETGQLQTNKKGRRLAGLFRRPKPAFTL